MPSPLIIQPSSKDNRLYLGASTTNYGSAPAVSAGRYTSTTIFRALVEFAIVWGTDIPAGAIIDSASLELYVTYAEGTDKAYYAQRLVRLDWVESQSTWVIYKTGSNWSIAGAGHSTDDYTATNQASANNPAAGNWITWNVLNLVKWAQTNNTNIAFRIVHSTEATDSENIDMASREYATTARRPKLTIAYTVPAVRRSLAYIIG